MRVFMTGGSGYIGSAVIKELLANGHAVIGLARSDSSQQRLVELGAEVVEGSLDDLDTMAGGAKAADAVMHLAFIHDFTDFASRVRAAEIDKLAIEAIGEALVNTNKVLVVTSGVSLNPDGRVVTENDEPDPRFPRQSEQAALAFLEHGVDVRIVRPSRFVHGDGVYGFITQISNIARDKGASAYVGDGTNCLHAVHRSDLAVLFRLALERGQAGAKYQGVADSSIPFREIAEAVGKRENVPTISIPLDQAAEHFGFLAQIVAAKNPASSEITQTALGWKPTHPSLLEDLA